jgi:hypothetical protein
MARPAGRLQFEGQGSSVHLLSAFCQEANLILAAEPIEQGEDKAEAELTAAPTVISQLDWQGRVLTAGTRLRVSLFCQRSFCAQVLAAGGDYLLTVKRNQLTLHRALVQVFDPEARPLLHRQECRTINQGHGRTAEVRHLIATADLWLCLIGPVSRRPSGLSGPGERKGRSIDRCATGLRACHGRSARHSGSCSCVV